MSQCLKYLYALCSQRYREQLNQKDEAASSREPLRAADFRPVGETTTDCLDENSHSDDTGSVTNVNSLQPTITLTRLNMQSENQQQEEQAEPDRTSQHFSTTSATSTGGADGDLQSKEEDTTSQASVVLPAGSREEPDSEPGAAAEDANEGEEEKEAPAVPGKKSGTGKAKTTQKRRSGRAANRC